MKTARKWFQRLLLSKVSVEVGLKFTLLAGLGNPGKEYSQTRHNIGFMVIDAVASELGQSLNKQQFDTIYTQVKYRDKSLFLVKPMSYMNRSGIPIQRLASYYKIDMEDIIVVHDDIDMTFGQVKIVQGRGHGGHNGVRSIIDSFGRKECIRVKVGVGHPGAKRDVTGHVLGKFTPDEQGGLASLIESASDACIAIINDGVVKAMNHINSRR
ncbi:MAG: aminoacyl-tRNA hydrolase [Desulfobacterales bacterium]|nr:MAG: aminoacyl-tRNA hydrolase [Desulfobacterales bacterium]